MKTELVHITKNKPFTTSLVIAESVGLEHRVVIRLVRKHQSDFEEFGFLNFESSKKRGTQGLKTEYAELSEDQATYLITLFRNTDIVRRFKIQLVKAFRNAINNLERLRNQKSEPAWQFIRDETKVGFKWMNENLKEQLESNGKTIKKTHFINESKLINGVITGVFSKINRNTLPEQDLKLIADLQRFNARLIAQNKPYDERKACLISYVTAKMQPKQLTANNNGGSLC